MTTASTPRSSYLLDVPPLSSGEVTEFLAFFPEIKDGTHSMFRSLSGHAQGVLWRARQRELLNDYEVTNLLHSTRASLSNNWGDAQSSYRLAEGIIHSTLLVAEAMTNYGFPLNRMHWRWIDLTRSAVIGYGFQGYGVISAPPKLSTIEEVLPVAGHAAYIVANSEYAVDPKESASAVMRYYADADQRGIAGTGIANPILDAYVRERPETGYQLGKISGERNLATAEDAKAAIDYLADTSGAKAISEGWL